jgi:hypothetical protein
VTFERHLAAFAGEAEFEEGSEKERDEGGAEI